MPRKSRFQNWSTLFPASLFTNQIFHRRSLEIKDTVSCSVNFCCKIHYSREWWTTCRNKKDLTNNVHFRIWNLDFSIEVNTFSSQNTLVISSLHVKEASHLHYYKSIQATVVCCSSLCGYLISLAWDIRALLPWFCQIIVVKICLVACRGPWPRVNHY